MSRFCRSLFVLFLVGFCAEVGVVHAQPPEILPAEIAAHIRPSIFLILAGKERSTGFLISQNPPLVATVAHDVVMMENPTEILVRADGTGTTWHAKSVRLHKEYVPQKSNKDPFSADVALIELEPIVDGSGVPLEKQFEAPLQLADISAAQDTRGWHVLMVGYPFYVALDEQERATPESVFRQGTIERLVDYDHTTTSSIVERPLLQHDMRTYEGDSGAPILDAAGKVIAIQCGVRTLTHNQTKETLAKWAVAVHVQALHQLIEEMNTDAVVRAP